MEQKEIAELREKWQAKINELVKLKSTIDSKIMGLQTMIKGLDYMEHGAPTIQTKLDPLPLPPELADLHSMGLTPAVRAVLTGAARALTPVQVRDRLMAYGYDKLPPGNPMAAIHGVLRRLLDMGEAKKVMIDLKVAYRILTYVEKMEQDAVRMAMRSR
jgi:hypothetical protein